MASAGASSTEQSSPVANSFTPLFSTLVLVGGFAALVGAAWAGYSALVVLLGLWLSAGVVTKLWSRLCLKGLTCERQLSERRVFPGEEVVLTLRVMNRKPLPLPWVEVRDEMPAALSPARPPGDPRASAPLPERPGFVALSQSTPLPWYAAASFTSRLQSSARGYYQLGPLSVTSGDIFGLHPRTRVQPDLDYLIVYPRTYALSELGLTSLSPLGNNKSELRMFADPSRLLGVREYVLGDSPRRIHWKASARTRALQVKVFESTTDLKVSVFLAVDTFAGLSSDDFELGISTAASVARHLLESDIQTGLFVNTKLADSGAAARVPAGSGTAQLALILEALAKTTAQISQPFADFFERERSELGFGGTLVFVVGEVSREIGLLTAELARTGRQLLGLYLANGGDAENGQGTDHERLGGWWRGVHRPADFGSADDLI